MRLIVPVTLLLMSASAAADEDPGIPGFDRPGIGFGTDAVPRGALALEFGLPSYLREGERDGPRSTTWSSDVLLRTGLAPRWELQLASTPWQRQQQGAADQPRRRLRGAGDSTLALKWTGPDSSAGTTWALLASAVVARGDAAFSDGRQYALGASLEHEFSPRWSAALYASHQRGDGQHSSNWSPSLALTVSERLGAYLEAGFSRSNDGPDQAIAGLGLTWLLRPNVQLDASFDLGLDADSPDLQFGTGLAIYLD